jgi:hypothetical protein
MIEHNIPQELARKVQDMADSCSRIYQQSPQEMEQIVRFVEAEMKGQHLPEAARGRDEFVADTFQQMYPKVLQSADCRNAVDHMLRKAGMTDGSSAFAGWEANAQYAIDPKMAEALFVTGAAVMGSVLMVTSGASGGAIRENGDRGYEIP